MADQQVSQTQTPAPVLTTPLQLLATDAEVGVCADGYCVLPPAAASE